jgi:hypothetical protein
LLGRQSGGDVAVGGLRGDIRLRAISTACSAPAVAAVPVSPPPAAAHEFVATLALTANLEIRRALTVSVRPKVQDQVFRTELIARMRDHPEWNAVFGR